MGMEPNDLIRFLGILEKLKSNTRHAWTSEGIQETVAAHSWRLATMALLIEGDVPDVDMDKVIRMCLIHDFGEAVTGDIPSFEKKERDEDAERMAIEDMLSGLPEAATPRLRALFGEMEAQETREARLYKALDKLEAVLQHNESPLSTWLPLEYDLQRTYAQADAQDFPFLKAFRAQLLEDTGEKIRSQRGTP